MDKQLFIEAILKRFPVALLMDDDSMVVCFQMQEYYECLYTKICEFKLNYFPNARFSFYIWDKERKRMVWD